MKIILSIFILSFLVSCDRENDKIVHLDVVAPEVKLLGSESLEIPFNTDYVDPGFEAFDVRDGDITYKVEIDNPVDTLTLGDYTITYKVTDANNNVHEVTRKVTVVDVVDPVIELSDPNPVTFEVFSPYVEPGFIATDDHDGNITDEVNVYVNNFVNMNVLGTYELPYNVSDSSGNTAITKTRTVEVVDTTKPIITLNGDNPMVLDYPEPYIEEGAIVTDNYYQGLTATPSGMVDTTKTGTYTVTYNTIDGSGNDQVETRTVIVQDLVPPTLNLLGDNPKIIEAGDEWVEPGYELSDNYDPSPSIEIDQGGFRNDTLTTYTFTYTATDSENNVTVITRTVIVQDTTPPVITGSNSEDLELGSVSAQDFIPKNITVSDNFDNNVTLTTSDTVDPNTIGQYILVYTSTDVNNNTSLPFTYTVNVVDTTPPVISVNGDPNNDILQLNLEQDLNDITIVSTDFSGIKSETKTLTPTATFTSPGFYNLQVVAIDNNDNETIKDISINYTDGTEFNEIFDVSATDNLSLDLNNPEEIYTGTIEFTYFNEDFSQDNNLLDNINNDPVLFEDYLSNSITINNSCPSNNVLPAGNSCNFTIEWDENKYPSGEIYSRMVKMNGNEYTISFEGTSSCPVGQILDENDTCQDNLGKFNREDSLYVHTKLH